MRGPLHGMPLAVKDVIDTVDMPTAYGSYIYRGHQPASDATCVALARAAGAIILGKTVTTEFATGTPGKTRNPHSPSHTPAGSSSGSAAAVAMRDGALGVRDANIRIHDPAYLLLWCGGLQTDLRQG